MKMKVVFIAAAILPACAPADPADSGAAPTVVAADLPGLPIATLTDTEIDRFVAGDAAFESIFVDAQGLGPAYIRTACTGCHADDGKGPGVVEKVVVFDGSGAPAADQSALQWGHTVRPYVAGGATTPLLAPTDVTGVESRFRTAPPVMGRGYVEAIDDAEILRVAAEQAGRDDGIHGRPNHVTYTSAASQVEFHEHAAGDVLLGRFGVKARVATADDFAADAYQGDMSITSPYRPDELANPDGLADDHRPGPDVPAETIEATADYVRLLDIPRREPDLAGEPLFAQVGCDVCHVPALATRDDYPIPSLAGIEAPVFTDLLLHDMGPELADGLTEGEAGPQDFKTAPLIGLRFQPYFLHDGSARTIEDAILAHGGESLPVIDRFDALSDAERLDLIAYVESL